MFVPYPPGELASLRAVAAKTLNVRVECWQAARDERSSVTSVPTIARAARSVRTMPLLSCEYPGGCNEQQ